MNLLSDKKIRLLNNAKSVMLSQYLKKSLLPNNAFCLLPKKYISYKFLYKSIYEKTKKIKIKEDRKEIFLCFFLLFPH